MAVGIGTIIAGDDSTSSVGCGLKSYAPEGDGGDGSAGNIPAITTIIIEQKERNAIDCICADIYRGT